MSIPIMKIKRWRKREGKLSDIGSDGSKKRGNGYKWLQLSISHTCHISVTLINGLYYLRSMSSIAQNKFPWTINIRFGKPQSASNLDFSTTWKKNVHLDMSFQIGLQWGLQLLVTLNTIFFGSPAASWVTCLTTFNEVFPSNHPFFPIYKLKPRICLKETNLISLKPT